MPKLAVLLSEAEKSVLVEAVRIAQRKKLADDQGRDWAAWLEVSRHPHTLSLKLRVWAIV
jgi:hypothetical protein